MSFSKTWNWQLGIVGPPWATFPIEIDEFLNFCGFSPNVEYWTSRLLQHISWWISRSISAQMGMDQYLLIPFLVGWTSINPSYFDVNYRGTRFWPTAKSHEITWSPQFSVVIIISSFFPLEKPQKRQATSQLDAAEQPMTTKEMTAQDDGWNLYRIWRDKHNLICGQWWILWLIYSQLW